jgi:hypothetical protein
MNPMSLYLNLVLSQTLPTYKVEEGNIYIVWLGPPSSTFPFMGGYGTRDSQYLRLFSCQPSSLHPFTHGKGLGILAGWALLVLRPPCQCAGRDMGHGTALTEDNMRPIFMFHVQSSHHIASLSYFYLCPFGLSCPHLLYYHGSWFLHESFYIGSFFFSFYQTFPSLPA